MPKFIKVNIFFAIFIFSLLVRSRGNRERRSGLFCFRCGAPSVARVFLSLSFDCRLISDCRYLLLFYSSISRLQIQRKSLSSLTNWIFDNKYSESFDTKKSFIGSNGMLTGFMHRITSDLNIYMPSAIVNEIYKL